MNAAEGRAKRISVLANPYTYTGRRLDPETGLYYYRNRYYHAQLGRFVSRDPIGYSGGWNLYGYVGGRPIGSVDPYGLENVEHVSVIGQGGMGVLQGGANIFNGVHNVAIDSHNAFVDAHVQTLTFGLVDTPDFLIWDRTYWSHNAFVEQSENAHKWQVWIGGQAATFVIGVKCVRILTPKGPRTVCPRTGWQAGDDIYASTKHGTPPSDRTVGRRFWRNEANNPSRSDYTPEDFARMQKGEPPRRFSPAKGDFESMDKSHEPIPKRDGGKIMVPRWPQEHAAIDPCRRPGY